MHRTDLEGPTVCTKLGPADQFTYYKVLCGVCTDGHKSVIVPVRSTRELIEFRCGAVRHVQPPVVDLPSPKMSETFFFGRESVCDKGANICSCWVGDDLGILAAAMLQVEFLWDVRFCRTVVLLKIEVFWDVRLCRTSVLLKIEVFWDVRLCRTEVLLKFEVFWDVRLCRTAVLLKIEVFWDVRLCRTAALLKIEVFWDVMLYRTAVLL